MLGGFAPALCNGLGLFFDGEGVKLASLALILRITEERAQGTLGCVGVLERRETTLAGGTEGLAASILDLELLGRQLFQTLTCALLEFNQVGSVFVLVDLEIKKNVNQVND